MSHFATAETLVESPSREMETVLVVEDDEAVRQAIGHVLECHGYRVLLASDAREALRAVLTDENVSIKVLIADIIMPKVSGREVADWLKTIFPDLKVLMTSGHPGEIHAYRCGQYPGEIFVPKPFNPMTLVDALKEALGE